MRYSTATLRPNAEVHVHPHKFITRTTGVEIRRGRRRVITSIRCERCRARKVDALGTDCPKWRPES